MRALPQQRRLADGRLHLHDGPIDLIIEAFGETSAIATAYAAAWRRFLTILDELCGELALLRADPNGGLPPKGPSRAGWRRRSRRSGHGASSPRWRRSRAPWLKRSSKP